MELQLVCLGVGAGKTMVYDGEPSSAFLFRIAPRSFSKTALCAGEGVLLIDCGLGVARACLKYISSLPPLIFVSHNHTDHAGELPVILAVERMRPGGCKRTVIAEKHVVQVLKERRLYETTPVGAYDADWLVCDVGQVTPIGSGLAIQVVGPCRHTELCFGFVLYQEDDDGADEAVSEEGQSRYKAICGFTGDTGLSADLLAKLAEAPLILADARRSGTSEHASFEELLDWRRSSGYGGRLVMYHYGSEADAPGGEYLEGGLEVTRPGEIVASWSLPCEEESQPVAKVAKTS